MNQRMVLLKTIGGEGAQIKLLLVARGLLVESRGAARRERTRKSRPQTFSEQRPSRGSGCLYNRPDASRVRWAWHLDAGECRPITRGYL